MISKAQRRNAERIVTLADTFGHLPFDRFGSTPASALNLSIPCAQLIVAGVVTGVDDTNDGVTDRAVRDVENTCRRAIEWTTEQYGSGWWNDKARELGVLSGVAV